MYILYMPVAPFSLLKNNSLTSFELYISQNFIGYCYKMY